MQPETQRELTAPTIAAPDRTLLVDLLWLTLAIVLLVASGIGLRDPWPADEPRFAVVARDMVASGDWLFPRVGGDLYQDKPPLFFWLLAAAYALTDSIRWSFLLPSLFASFGTVMLVYDLARRLVDRNAALGAALVLAFTVQFAVAGRAAQIDATLCFLTTFSLYALLRHLLLGPAWGWCFAGGLAAGLGVITKGVGFLPLLVFLPYAVMRSQGFEPLPRFAGGARWALPVAGFLLGVGVWLVPMLVAASMSADAALFAYRDEILFRQTLQRYASAWHHVRPWHYFFVEVIPLLWLPVSALLIWLVPRWAQALRARDARVWLPLAWVLVTLVFFTASPGKRGIYVLPALPAVVLAAAPFLPELSRHRTVQRVGLALAAMLVVAAIAVLLAEAFGVEAAVRALRSGGVQSTLPLWLFAAAGLVLWVWALIYRPILAWPAVLVCLAVIWAYGIAPQMNPGRSGKAFMEAALARVRPRETLALMRYKEQFLLYLDRPSVNFGHRRWLEGPREAYDAARWLNAGADRVLLLPESHMSPCFSDSPRELVGYASRDVWFLVRPPAAGDCAERGEPRNAIRYASP